MTGFRLTRAQMREVDRLSIEEYGICGIVLMENAGRAVADVIHALFVPNTASARPPWRCVVLCGPGNNGGDGFVIARWLFEADLDVTCLCTATRDETRGDARLARASAERVGVAFVSIATEAEAWGARDALDRAGPIQLVVDALLGTGFEGPMRPNMARAITLANELRTQGARVLSVDVPSGLDCDTGRKSLPSVTADVTVTFECQKVGFVAADAASALGRVLTVPIGAPRDAIDRARGSRRRRLTGR